MQYLLILRILTASTLLFAFWPVMRLLNVTIFDWLTTTVVICSLPYRSLKQTSPQFNLKLPVRAIYLFSIAATLATISSLDKTEHVKRASVLILAFATMLAFSYVIAKKNIFSFTTALTLLALSGAISSLVVILQGQFGILTSLVSSHSIQEWNRLTGLTEHPIEAGSTAGFSAVISAGLALHTRRWVPFLALILIDLYSMNFSASLTANFSIALGLCAVFIFARASSTLIAVTIATAIAVAIMLSQSSTSKLASRLENLEKNGTEYKTVQTREAQMESTIDSIGPTTLLVGNGYSTDDLPDNLDIHNGILASVFHFGVAGLASQLMLLYFFLSRMWSHSSRNLRATLLGSIIVFASSYLTAPALARRQLWIPLFTMGVYLSASPPALRRGCKRNADCRFSPTAQPTYEIAPL